MAHVPLNPHTDYPREALVRQADSLPDDMVEHYVYGLTDTEGVWRYVGSCSDRDRRLRSHLHPSITQSSPLVRYMRENGPMENWTMHELQRVAYDKRLCSDALRIAEDGFIRRLRDDGHPLLNHNKAYLATTRHAEQQRAWRAAHPNYMRDYCRQWRAQKRAEAVAQMAQYQSV
eukprot:COSAG06_NODE_8044_length_2289_cov_1.948882_2_plen_174_part_00